MDYIENPEPEEIEQVKSKILYKMDLCAKSCAQELRTPDISKLHFDKLTYDELCMLCSCCGECPVKKKLCFLKARLGIGVGQMKLFNIIHPGYEESFLALTMPELENENGYLQLVRYFGEFGFGTGERSKRFDSPMSLQTMNKYPEDTITIAFKLIHDQNERKPDRKRLDRFRENIDCHIDNKWICLWKPAAENGWYDNEIHWIPGETSMEHWFVHGLVERIGHEYGGCMIDNSLKHRIGAEINIVFERAKLINPSVYGREDYMLRVR